MFSMHRPLIVPQIPAIMPHSLPQEHPGLQGRARHQGLERLLKQNRRTHLPGRHQAEVGLQDKQERFAPEGQDNREVIIENQQQQKSQQEIYSQLALGNCPSQFASGNCPLLYSAKTRYFSKVMPPVETRQERRSSLAKGFVIQ